MIRDVKWRRAKISERGSVKPRRWGTTQLVSVLKLILELSVERIGRRVTFGTVSNVYGTASAYYGCTMNNINKHWLSA